MADARALKTLNDSKLSMELLWENASPASKFGEQYIPFGKTGSGLYMLVYTGVNNQRTFCEFLKKGLFTLYFKGFPSGNEYYRNGTVFDENIYFIDARNWTTADYQGSVSNNALIPVQLYEIKGVSQ